MLLLLKWELILIFLHQQAEISVFSDRVQSFGNVKVEKPLTKWKKTAHSFFANNSKYHKDSKNSTQERKNYIYPKIKWVNLELLFWGGHGTWKNFSTDDLTDKNDRNIGAFGCQGNYRTCTCWSSLQGRAWRWTDMKYNIMNTDTRGYCIPLHILKLENAIQEAFCNHVFLVFLSIVSWRLLEQIFNQSICLHMLCKWNQRDIFILHSVTTSLTKCKLATPHC